MYQPFNDGLEHRFFELRFDGDRTVAGTAMRYGDVAVFPWGDEEEFARGAFGDLRNADVIMDVMHDRLAPVARTGGGGLDLRDSGSMLEVTAALPQTTAANDALTLVRSKVLRGLSVGFKPISVRRQGKRNIIERAELKRVAIVDDPAYSDSKLNRSKSMDEAQVRAMIEEARNQDGGKNDLDVGLLARSIADGVKTSVTGQITEALEARDKAAAEKQAAEEQRQRAEADAEKNAERRADIIVLCRDLLPDTFEVRGKANKDILAAAVGDEVTDVENRSEDYLMAKVEAIAERRSSTGAANARNRQAAGSGAGKGGTTAAPLNPFNMPRQTK